MGTSNVLLDRNGRSHVNFLTEIYFGCISWMCVGCALGWQVQRSRTAMAWGVCDILGMSSLSSVVSLSREESW